MIALTFGQSAAAFAATLAVGAVAGIALTLYAVPLIGRISPKG